MQTLPLLPVSRPPPLPPPLSPLPSLDILVNNAGIQFVAPVHELPDDKCVCAHVYVYVHVKATPCVWVRSHKGTGPTQLCMRLLKQTAGRGQCHLVCVCIARVCVACVCLWEAG